MQDQTGIATVLVGRTEGNGRHEYIYNDGYWLSSVQSSPPPCLVIEPHMLNMTKTTLFLFPFPSLPDINIKVKIKKKMNE